MADIEHDQYNDLSTLYDEIETFPMSHLYQQMMDWALGDCTGKTVLDLGGGSGFHARKAVDHGASFVDVVDASAGMMENGKTVEAKLGRKDRLRWHLGDISLPLDDLPLEKAYDIVLVNWTFDHAESNEALEAMWKNTSQYTKPGGKLISIRMHNMYSKAATAGQYGVTFSDIKEIPGGLRYVYTAHTTPPMSCPASTMSESLDFNQAKAMAERHGFKDFQKVPPREMKAVKDDPDFWRLYLEDEYFITIVATKAT